MVTVFQTRQFRVGNSQAVRLPSKMAYLPGTELTVTRMGDRIIIEPKEESLSGFVEWLKMAAAKAKGQEWERIDTEFPDRDWS